ELAAQDGELAPLEMVTATESLEAQVAEALGARPEVRESAALAEAAEQTAKGAEWGPLIPTVAGQAFVGTLGGGRDAGPTRSGSSRDYVAAVAWRLGLGGLFDMGRVHATQARLEEARWRVEKLKDAIARQVVEAQTRVISQRQQLETAKD